MRSRFSNLEYDPEWAIIFPPLRLFCFKMGAFLRFQHSIFHLEALAHRHVYKRVWACLKIVFLEINLLRLLIFYIVYRLKYWFMVSSELEKDGASLQYGKRDLEEFHERGVLSVSQSGQYDYLGDFISFEVKLPSAS